MGPLTQGLGTTCLLGEAGGAHGMLPGFVSFNGEPREGRGLPESGRMVKCRSASSFWEGQRAGLVLPVFLSF